MQKPIYLLEKLIRTTTYEIELILEPFADQAQVSSWYRTNRNAIRIEQEKNM
ncbi:hypothetical protein [Mesomycoplasma ovipneumoniae]|uniref:hypothetical protein n=1 Tax=Mesomycoplasma ovipneumoniae TaxID=29562 RepID=UPI0028AFE7B3|nr:hypothetical protein [Mesomycoplasma ovipneumoniae]MDW2861804.1 hypothetical protein [Mesomycoplasma ovipneumoniae]WNM14531.1 hypothetical protein RNL96_01730 [Mesomycoplasma ovipneumoniae]